MIFDEAIKDKTENVAKASFIGINSAEIKGVLKIEICLK